MGKDMGEHSFTNKVDNETAQVFYNTVFNAASQDGTDVRVKKTKSGTLKIQKVKTENITN